MNIRLIFLIILSKIICFISHKLNIGAGSTWPGYLALKIYPNIVSDLAKQISKGIIVIAGTNGKTTTAKIISDILKKEKYKIIKNQQGANLLSGIASTLLQNATFNGKIISDYGIFEVDENVLPKLASLCKIKCLVLTNLFRDQLDRYGEIENIVKIWKKTILQIDYDYGLILNADDPQISYLGKHGKQKILYFGLAEKYMKNQKVGLTADSSFCPNCELRLKYQKVAFSHLGIWDCHNCGFKRPIPDIATPLPSSLKGIYNLYNILAANLTLNYLNINSQKIADGFLNFVPAFGRQEKIENYGKKYEFYLSKNPTSFNQSLETIIMDNQNNQVLFLLINDRIPDGQDISWIWDINLEILLNNQSKFEIVVSGDRYLDLLLRLKYAGFSLNKIKYSSKLKEALNNVKKSEIKTVSILANYSAMLNLRKELVGQKFITD